MAVWCSRSIHMWTWRLPPDSDQPGYAYAASVRLMADLEACESYYFFCDDPETLHENYDILANADGKIAGIDEFESMNTVS